MTSRLSVAVVAACLPAATSLVSPLRAGAPTPLDPTALRQMSLDELSQLEVTSPSKAPKPAFDSPVAIFVLTADDIHRSGATSIPEALRRVPGVEVARIDGNKWSIGIRGFGSRLSRSVLVLIDGRTVYTTFFAGTYWEVQDTVMDDIDRIEVIRGAGGTIWGPNAVDGVINIITKDTRDTHGTQVSAGGGNEEQGFASVRYGGAKGQDFNYRVYAKGFTRGPEAHPGGTAFDDWRAGQAGFRLDWALPDAAGSERDSVTVSGDMYREEAGERVNATSYAAPYSRDIDGNAHLSGGNVVGRWKRTFGDGEDIQLQGYFDRTSRNEPNFGELRNTFDIDFLQRHRLGGRQQLSWGAGVRFSHGDALQVVSGLTFDPPGRTDQLFTGFLQDEIVVVPERLSLIFGTKLLKTNFTGVLPEPSARLLFTPDARQTFWTAYTHALRTPSRVEEDFNLSGYIGTTPSGIPYFARFNANDHFAPEQLNGYEFGYRRLVGRGLGVGVAGFYNRYHNLFSEEITGSTYLEDTPAPAHYLLPAQFRNGLAGSAKGGEVASDWRPVRFWTLRGTYSYVQIALHRAPGSADVGTAPGIEGSSPRHQVTVLTDLDLRKRFSVDFVWRYVSALPGQLVPAYSTGDARLAWQKDQHLEVSVAGRNLFQQSHPEFGGDPGPLVDIRRSIYGKVTWTY